MSRLTEIYEGWKNVIFPTPEIEALAKERALVCAECDFLILGVCSKCCCPHLGKTHNPSSRCPENKWKDGWGSPVQEEQIQQNQQPPYVIPLPSILYWDEARQEWTNENPENRIFLTMNPQPETFSPTETL